MDCLQDLARASCDLLPLEPPATPATRGRVITSLQGQLPDIVEAVINGARGEGVCVRLCNPCMCSDLQTVRCTPSGCREKLC
jgi:hypothetical protein